MAMRPTRQHFTGTGGSENPLLPPTTGADDGGVPGSSQVFIALHSAMLDRDQVAFGTFARTHSAGLRLVALLPQEEMCDEEGNQVRAGSHGLGLMRVGVGPHGAI